RMRRDGREMPDRNDEYFLYQTLVGAWPLDPYGPGEVADFVSRIQSYMQKAVHEAKVHTRWVKPDPGDYGGVQRLVARVLDALSTRRFLEDFRSFQARVSDWGLFNSLSQVLLKVASPGVPDVYQGTELWDFSLVDPDNRRPVDYDLRAGVLRSNSSAQEMLKNLPHGKAKLHVIAKGLALRRRHAGLYRRPAYIALHADAGRE